MKSTISILTLVALGSLTSAQSITLQNTKAAYTFEFDAEEAWLVQGKLKPQGILGDRIVTFERTPMWDISLRIDPDLTAPEQPNVSESRRNTQDAQISLNLPALPDPTSPNPKIVFTWIGSFPDEDNPPQPSQQPPQVRIDAIWQLRSQEDFLRARIEVEIQNPAGTRYKIWSCAFPRLWICNLGDADYTKGLNAAGDLMVDDFLATGKYGGLLYGNPIHFKDEHDPQMRGFLYQKPSNEVLGLPDFSGLEPGAQTVPLWCYYSTSAYGFPMASNHGVYLSHNDDEGMFKGVSLKALPLVPACPGPYEGVLEFEIVQYPHSTTRSPNPTGPCDPELQGPPGVGIFEMIQYEAPYAVFVGVFDGDWVDAAKKYRSYRIGNTDGRFAWLDLASRPSGKDTNMFIPEELKKNPYQLTLLGGQVSEPWDGSGGVCAESPEFTNHLNTAEYCVDRLHKGGGLNALSARLAFFEDEFWEASDPGFTLKFDRFPVAAQEIQYPPGIGDVHFNPSSSPLMETVHVILQGAGDDHLLLLDSLTEKYNRTDHHIRCEPLGAQTVPPTPPTPWICEVDPDYIRLVVRNALIARPKLDSDLLPDCAGGPLLPGYVLIGSACPAGKATTRSEFSNPECSLGQDPTCGTKWGPVFSDIVSEAAVFHNARGIRWNAPSTVSFPCFAKEHDHLPGFGNAVLKGWYDIFQAVRDATMMCDFVFLPELGSTTFSKYHRVQNPISLDYGADLDNVYRLDNDPLATDRDQWNRYFDAPIKIIPMVQMVADEIRFVDHRTGAYMSLPWTMSSTGAPPFDVDNNGCRDTKRFFQFLPNPLICDLPDGPSCEGMPVDYPSVPAALNCWSMAKRVFVHQASIMLSDFNMAATPASQDPNPLSIFDDPPSTRSEWAARGMLEFYRGLGKFLMYDGLGPGSDEVYMEYFTGTMERSPRVYILNAAETFNVDDDDALDDDDDLDEAFVNLHNHFIFSYDGTGEPTQNLPEANPEHPGRPKVDWRFDRYRPVDQTIFAAFRDGAMGDNAIPIAPNERESWLPHGVYRSWRDESKLVLFIANPWGVPHLLNPGSSPSETRPMNIFTFKFETPVDSPTSNNYQFAFQFDPKDYGFEPTTSYTVKRTRFGTDGLPLMAVDFGSGAGIRTFSTFISAFQYEAFEIDFQ